MYDFKLVFVECGQRPPASVDTSRPTEDSPEIGTYSFINFIAEVFLQIIK